MKIGRCIVMGWTLYRGCHLCKELMDRFKIPLFTVRYGVVE
jgi:hypothetical protein